MRKPPRAKPIIGVKQYKRPLSLVALSYAKVVRALWEGRASYSDLCEASALHHNTVRTFVRALRQEDMSHVDDFGPDARGRNQVALFNLGPGKDAARAPRTSAERQRRMYQRKKLAKALGIFHAPPR